MATKNYRVYFHWFIDDVELPKGYLDILINKKGVEEILDTVFMEAYNRGVDALNGHYEEWNKEFDALGGNKTDEDHKLYDRFICKKQNEILKKIPDDAFELFTDPEFGECSICGRFKNAFRNTHDVKVQITLEAV